MDFLKEHLGEDLFGQVQEKLKDNKDVKLANLAEGQHVGIGKFKALEDSVKALNASLSERDEQLEALSKSSGNVDDLKKKIGDLQSANEEAQNSHAAALAKANREAALSLLVANARPADDNASAALRRLLDDKVGDDGDTKEAENFLGGLRETSAYFFEGNNTSSNNGGNPPNTEDETETDFDTKLRSAIVGEENVTKK